MRTQGSNTTPSGQRATFLSALPFSSSSLLLLFRKNHSTRFMKCWLFSLQPKLCHRQTILGAGHVKRSEIAQCYLLRPLHTTTLWCFRNDKTGNKWGAELVANRGWNVFACFCCVSYHTVDDGACRTRYNNNNNNAVHHPGRERKWDEVAPLCCTGCCLLVS